VINKICMTCFRKYFGPDAKINTVTWSTECQACHEVTPRGGTLIKADVTATVLGERAEQQT